MGIDVDPVLDPFAALEDLAGQAVTLVEVLRSKVSHLQDVGYSSKMGLEQVKAELQVYLSALTRAESILGRIVSLDLDARRVRIEEAKAAVIVSAMSKVLAHRDLALSADQQARGRALLVAGLRREAVTV